MNHRELVLRTQSEEDAIAWSKENEYIKSEMVCRGCNEREMKVVLKWGGRFFRCGSRRTEKSIFDGTIFKNSKLTTIQLIDLVYFWSKDNLQSDAREERQINSSQTSHVWYKKFQINASEIMKTSNSEKIGGNGIIVEIDESLFTKRKYNFGRIVRNKWVVGGIDSNGETFFVETLFRNKAALNEIIIRNVKPGSFIFTDEWSGYNDLNSLGYFNYIVNHRENFVNPNTGVNTQRIENLWCMQEKN